MNACKTSLSLALAAARAAASSFKVYPKMDQYEFQYYERQLNNFRYASDLYPEWGWAMDWIFHTLDGKRPNLSGTEGFSLLRGNTLP